MPVILLGGGFKAVGDVSPASLKIWLDASAITGKNDGDAAGNWPSLVSGGITLDPASGSPTYKTNIRNGKPIVRFDGVDDYSNTSSAIANFIGTTSATVFAVFSWTDGLVNPEQVFSFADGGTYRYWFGATGVAQASMYYNGGYYSSKAAANATWYIMSAWYDATNSYMSLTDTRTASAASSTGFAAQPNVSWNLFVTAGAGYVGIDLAEFATWNTTLTEVERQDVERGLANKWGFSLPY